MVVRRRRKHLKFRGNRHQGYGSHKKHRGGGSQGGKGRAGLHKHKWSYVVKYEPDAFGKFGFKRPQATLKEIRAVNVGQLDQRAEKLFLNKAASREGDAIKINAASIGFDKILGSGRVSRKLIVEAKYFSEEAKKKLEDAGGQALILAQEKGRPREKKREETATAKPAEPGAKNKSGKPGIKAKIAKIMKTAKKKA